MKVGLTLSSEEHGPRELIDLAILAEDRGFDFVSISDHYHPWISAQGHSPFVWSVLGGIAQATRQYRGGCGRHLSDSPYPPRHPCSGRGEHRTPDGGTPDLGSGNRRKSQRAHSGRPLAGLRGAGQDAGRVDRTDSPNVGRGVCHPPGHYFTVEDARILDRPDTPVPIVISAFGETSAELAARVGDGLWLSSLNEETIAAFNGAAGSGPVFSQLTLCWGPDRDEAVTLAHSHVAEHRPSRTAQPGTPNDARFRAGRRARDTRKPWPRRCRAARTPIRSSSRSSRHAGGSGSPLFPPDRRRSGGFRVLSGRKRFEKPSSVDGNCPASGRSRSRVEDLSHPKV